MDNKELIGRIINLFKSEEEDEYLISYLSDEISEFVDISVLINNGKVIVYRSSNVLYTDKCYIIINCLLKNGAIFSTIVDTDIMISKSVEFMIKISSTIMVKDLKKDTHHNIFKPKYSVGDTIYMVGNKRSYFIVKSITFNVKKLSWDYHDEFGYASENNVCTLTGEDIAEKIAEHLVWIEKDIKTGCHILVNSFQDVKTKRKIEDWEITLFKNAGIRTIVVTNAFLT